MGLTFAGEVEAMTAKKDLKRLVRARMAETGEVYTKALAEVRRVAEPPPRESLIDELYDLTVLARRAGLACRAEVSHKRWREVGVREPADAFFERAFAGLSRLLIALDGAPGVARMRAAVMDGVTPAPMALTTVLSFFAQVRAGVRSVCPSGHFAALDITDGAGAARLVVFFLWQRPQQLRASDPPPPPNLNVQIDPRLDRYPWFPS